MSVPRAIRDARERIVPEHMEAENALEMDRALETFAHPALRDRRHGRSVRRARGGRPLLSRVAACCPDQRNELISLGHAEDAVIVEFWLLGTHKGRLGGLEPTSREFMYRMTAFFIFKGDGLVCERVYFDSATILRQLTE